MIFKELPLPGAYIISLEKKNDERGFFARYFCEDEFKQYGLNTDWKQMNTSLSIKKNTLRGLHYQKIPKTESKLVRCIKGSIFDVIVDLRFGSKTYGEWTSCELSDKNRDMIYIPDGFAHGYMTTSDNTEIIYNVSEFYDEEYEGSICWNDSNLDIDWPHKPISISKKDKEAKTIKELEPIKL